MGWHDQDGRTAARIARLRWETGRVTEEGVWSDPQGRERPYWVWHTDWCERERTWVVLDRHPSSKGRPNTRDLRWLRRRQRRGEARATPVFGDLNKG